MQKRHGTDAQVQRESGGIHRRRFGGPSEKRLAVDRISGGSKKAVPGKEPPFCRYMTGLFLCGRPGRARRRIEWGEK